MINILTTYSNLYKVTKILSKSAIIKELSIYCLFTNLFRRR